MNDAPPGGRMALTEVERRLVDGFRWHVTVVHEAHHRDKSLRFDACPHKTCRYATSILTWADERDSIDTSKDEPTNR